MKEIKVKGKIFKDVLKEEKIKVVEKLRRKTSEIIVDKYPTYKQTNVNELQGCSKEEKEKMWIFINNKRDWCNKLEEKIKRLKNVERLKEIEDTIDKK